MRNDRGLALLFAALLAPAAWAADAPPDGAKLYQLNCKLCHGPQGTPPPGFVKKGVPSLNDPEWQKKRSDDEIRKTISEGVKDTLMKAFKDDLSKAQIDALVKQVRSLAPAAAK